MTERSESERAELLPDHGGADAGVECPNCHDANKYGDYEGPTCEVCMGDGVISKPAVAANASAEDLLREALTDLQAWCDEKRTILGPLNGGDYRSGKNAAYCYVLIEIKKRLEALSAHPHASDCDKQGSDCGATRCRDLGCFGACAPSDRTADVTVEEISLVLLDGFKAGKAPIQIARALLDAFTVGRR